MATASAGVYRPRYPERTVLYRVLAQHFVQVYDERFEPTRARSNVVAAGYAPLRQLQQPLVSTDLMSYEVAHTPGAGQPRGKRPPHGLRADPRHRGSSGRTGDTATRRGW